MVDYLWFVLFGASWVFAIWFGLVFFGISQDVVFYYDFLLVGLPMFWWLLIVWFWV